MGLADPHDKRTFTHFAKLDADGNVIAIVEVADGSVVSSPPGLDGRVHVDVTDLRVQKIDPFLVTVTDTAALASAADMPAREHADLKAHFEAEALKTVGFEAQRGRSK